MRIVVYANQMSPVAAAAWHWAYLWAFWKWVVIGVGVLIGVYLLVLAVKAIMKP